MLAHDYPFDTVQMPLNCFDGTHRSGPPRPLRSLRHCDPAAVALYELGERRGVTRRGHQGSNAHTARDVGSRPSSRARVHEDVPEELPIPSRYGVVNSRTSLFSPSLLPLLSIDVTV